MEVQMSMIVIWLKKVFLVAAAAALGLGSLPMANVFALEPSDLVRPTPPAQQPANRLERVWSREQTVYNRLGTFFNNSDQLLSKAQGLIDEANANGKDTYGLQAALNTFSNAIKQAEPIYQEASGIVSSHQGFDEYGKVIDQAQALATAKDLGSKLREIRQILMNPRKALREAVKAFREANRPAATPAPPQSSG
jgi:hypothetical protein